MHTIWNFLLERRSVTWLILLGCVGYGFFDLFTIQRESSPEVQVPFAIITTVLPGASPKDTETLVTNEIEKAVGTIENIKTLSSASREGVSVVSVEFQASANLTTSIQKVRDEVDKVKNKLPKDATDPVVSDINFADQPIIIAAISSDLAPSAFKTFTDTIKDRIEQIQGVSRAEVSGVRAPEVTVIARSTALSQYGLSLNDIVQSLAMQNAATPVGSLEQDNVAYTVSLKGAIEEPSEVARLPITTPQGQTLTLQDIAIVSDGIETAQTISRISKGGSPSQQAAIITVFKQRGADITKTTANVHAVLSAIEQENKGVLAQVSFDSGEQIRTDLSELSRTGAEAVFLVVLALFATLGWREALVAGLSIPLSILLSFIALKESGNTINFISLFSLILSIGILVDSAIVITEAIHVNIRKGLGSFVAAKNALTEYSYPLTAGTLTTVAVFLPLFTISGITGQFIKSIPFTVISVLLASLFVALGLTPLIAATWFKPQGVSPFELRQERYAEASREWYKKNIVWFLDNKRRKQWFMGGMVALFVAGLMLPMVGLVKALFFPQSDVDYLYLEIEEAPGTTLSKTDLATRGVEEVLYPIPEIISFTTSVGSGSSFSSNPQSGPRFASINITLEKAKERTRSSTQILEDIQERIQVFKSFTVRAYEPSNGPPSGAPIKITFEGDDLLALKATALKAQHILSEIKGTSAVTSSAQADTTELSISIDRTKAADLGLSPLLIAQTLRTAIFGTEATDIKKNGDTIKVVVKADLNPQFNAPADTNKATIDALRELPITTPRGTVLLGSVLSVSLANADDAITHEAQKRIVTVSSQLVKGAYATDITTEFSKRAQTELPLPEGVHMKLGGENEDVNQSFIDMFRALLFGIVLIFMILIVTFNRYRLAFFVLSVVPLSLIGVLFGLLITFQPISFPTMLGFIALAGVVVNHAIILVDVFNRLRKEHPDMPLRTVVIEGGAIRLRPILLTKATAIIGLIPLLFAGGLWQPIAVAMIFGLSFTGVLTLIFLPILYLKWGK